MVVQRDDLMRGFQALQLDSNPVIVHSSLKALGRVEGGAETVVSALLATFDSVIAPTFTYKTMLTPLVGPADNAITYGSGNDHNRMAEFYTPSMPADSLMGIIPETLRIQPNARRSMHPILSFAGVNADAAIVSQSMDDPFAPIGYLASQDGWVLLLGVNHMVNTSIHYAEKLAGRRQFVRWALTPQGVRECPSWPGCSFGFDAIAPNLARHTRSVEIGAAYVQAVELNILFEKVVDRIKKDPLALLCQREDCERCNQIRFL